MASRSNASQDLLLGLLALQSGLIDQAQLLAAFETWTHAEDRTMVEIFLALDRQVALEELQADFSRVAGHR